MRLFKSTIMPLLISILLMYLQYKTILIQISSELNLCMHAEKELTLEFKHTFMVLFSYSILPNFEKG